MHLLCYSVAMQLMGSGLMACGYRLEPIVLEIHDMVLAICDKNLVHKDFTNTLHTFMTSNTLYSLPQQTAKAANALQPVALLQKCIHLGT